jgi:adenylate cyclase, class 2
MSKTNDEIEAKFWISDMVTLRARTQDSGAKLVHRRVKEINLRFDSADGMLSRQSRVLRLRKDYGVHLTYKGASRPDEAVSVRQEIEFEVNSYKAARAFLEALDYRVIVMYEKFRTGYEVNDLVIALDEMPFGNFCEIEGPNVALIRSMADSLGLDWEARTQESYLGLFARLQQAGLQAQNLTFDEFKGVTVTPEQLGLRAADKKL